MKRPLQIVLGIIAALGLAAAHAAPAANAQSSVVIFENVRIFDGTADRLSGPSNVLVIGKVITQISSAPLTPPPATSVTRIAGDGRTLMPGLIDAHTHIMFSTVPQAAVLTSDVGYLNVAAVKAANDMLLRGFTSIRDLGGPVFGLKRGIDTGLVPGPRIWPAGAFVSQSGGHGDFRLPNELPAPPGSFSFSERIGAAAIADSPDAVRQRVREQLALGASQIKLMAGGGVASSYDPLDVTQYYRGRAARSGGGGGKLGHLCHGACLHPARGAPGDRGRREMHRSRASARRGYREAHGRQGRVVEPAALHRRRPLALSRRIAEPGQATRDVQRHRRRLRARQEIPDQDRLGHGHPVRPRGGGGAGPHAREDVALVHARRDAAMATADNAALLALSGLRSPYPGKLGVVEEGALADLLLVDGDPLANIELIADPERNFVVIIKDGKVYKNLLP